MAQVPQSPTAGLTPNARSFHRYGEIPVSLYTGTPNITIPIDTINDGTLSLPIALSYHSGGIKADEHPGWVGLGWTLMLGGAITREVRDLPDEYDCNSYNWGYFHVRTLLDNDNLWKQQSSEEIYSMLGKISDPTTVAAYFDLEPDKFSFNFDGYSGFFFMDEKGKWQINSNRPIKIKSITFSNSIRTNSVEIPINCKTINTITLTGDDGTDYVFGKDAIETSIDFKHQKTAIWIASTWYLKEIQHTNGNKITFNYERDNYIARLIHSYYGESIYSNKDNINKFVGGESHDGKLISPVYLSSINGQTFSIVLHRSLSNELNYSLYEYTRRLNDMAEINPDRPPHISAMFEYPIYLSEGKDFTAESQAEKIKWQKLDSIVLNDNNGSPYKTIRFNYNNHPSHRLALLSLNISDRFGIQAESFSFKYHNLNNLPKYLSQMTDHWGYYNGTLIDIYDKSTKNTNPQTVAFGSLSEITYPTGGKTWFEFEPNRYSQIANSQESGDLKKVDENYAGGVRIKRIVNIPSDSTIPEQKEYLYLRGFNPISCDSVSSGILDGDPTYSASWTVDNGNMHISQGSIESLSKLISESGTHIGYSEVVEKNSDGYSISTFTSHNDSECKDISPLIASDPDPLIHVSDRSIFRGRLKQHECYDSNGRILSKREFRYSPSTGIYTFVPAILFNRGERTKFSFYKNYTCNLVESFNSETIYGTDNNIMFHKEHFRNFNADAQIISDSTVTYRNGSRNSNVTNYEYTWNHNADFLNRHLKCYIGNIINKRNGNVLNHIINEYSLIGDTPFLKKVIAIAPDNNPRQLYKCFQPNKKGQPVNAMFQDQVPVTYLWGADYIHPLAEIKGVPFGVLNQILGFDADKSPNNTYTLDNKISVLRSSLPQTMVTQYKYKPHLGITQITDNSDKTTYFHYDAYGRLSTINNMHRDKIQSYYYSTASIDSLGMNPDALMKQYYDRNLEIIGPEVSHPGNSFHYWPSTDIDDVNHRWELSGDTTSLSLDFKNGYTLIHNSSSNKGTAQLSLIIYNDRGFEICRKIKIIQINNGYFNLDFKKDLGNDTEATCTFTLRRNDNTKVYTVLVSINGHFNRKIDRDTDLQFCAASNGVRGVVHVPRDNKIEFYQITIDANGVPDAWEFPANKLFQE